MKGQSVVFSKGKDDWRTPRTLFDQWNEKFRFTTDVAADVHNTLVSRHWFGPGSPDAEDALVVTWGSINWCNPPYSRVKEFVAKAAHEMKYNRKTVMLIPSRTDTKWFHEHIYRKTAVDIHFIKGRVKFVNPDGPLRQGHSSNSAPFPSMIVVFG